MSPCHCFCSLRFRSQLLFHGPRVCHEKQHWYKKASLSDSGYRHLRSSIPPKSFRWELWRVGLPRSDVFELVRPTPFPSRRWISSCLTFRSHKYCCLWRPFSDRIFNWLRVSEWFQFGSVLLLADLRPPFRFWFPISFRSLRSLILSLTSLWYHLLPTVWLSAS